MSTFDEQSTGNFDIVEALKYLSTCAETRYSIKDKMLYIKEQYNKSQSTKYRLYQQCTSYRIDKILTLVISKTYYILSTDIVTDRCLIEISRTLDTLSKFIQNQLDTFDKKIEQQATIDAEYIKQLIVKLQEILDNKKFIKGREM